MEGALAAFTAEVRRPADEVRLDRAALLIAAGEYPGLDIEAFVALLDEIAGSVRPAGSGARALAGAVRRRLFDDLGFRGNERDYYDPRNSYLNDVLLRRTGIPISLAAVFLEVARRVGLEAAGVGFPGHFLVKYQGGEEEWIVDPFHRGIELSGRDFRTHLMQRGAEREEAADYYLAAVTPRQMLIRMLANLKAIYIQREDIARALRIQEYLLAITPWSFPDIRDRGLLRARAGDTAGALADLETYLAYADGDDAPAVRAVIERLRAGKSPDGGT